MNIFCYARWKVANFDSMIYHRIHQYGEWKILKHKWKDESRWHGNLMTHSSGFPHRVLSILLSSYFHFNRQFSHNNSCTMEDDLDNCTVVNAVISRGPPEVTLRKNKMTPQISRLCEQWWKEKDDCDSREKNCKLYHREIGPFKHG